MNRTVLLLILFLSSSLCQLNRPDDTASVIKRHLSALNMRNLTEIFSDFTLDSYVLYLNSFHSGEQIRSLFRHVFSEDEYYHCADHEFRTPFIQEKTAHVNFSLTCGCLQYEGSATYEVSQGAISQMIYDRVLLAGAPSNCSSNGTNNGTSNTTNKTTWEIAKHQYSALIEQDIESVLSDYAEDAFALLDDGNNTRTKTGYWELYDYFNDIFVEIERCGSSFWQTPSVKRNMIYQTWISFCDGVKRVGTNTLVINSHGRISSMIVSPSEIKRHQYRRNETMAE